MVQLLALYMPTKTLEVGSFVLMFILMMEFQNIQEDMPLLLLDMEYIIINIFGLYKILGVIGVKMDLLK